MTKSQLVELISGRAPHVPRHTVEAIVNAVFDTMTDSLKRDERIEIRGFGSLGVKVRPQRNGRNPKTGAKVFVPARRTPYFTVGKELKFRLNKDSPGALAREGVESAEPAELKSEGSSPPTEPSSPPQEPARSSGSERFEPRETVA
jgi:integration host factor subunit beta